MYLCIVFILVWLAIGSILFWRDCIHLLPNIVNIYMWLSLISGFLSVISSTYIFKINKKKQKSSIPLLDIA